MADRIDQTSVAGIGEGLPVSGRIQARMQAQVTWVDEDTGERISIKGQTENLGVSSALVNLNLLPKVGRPVKLSISDDDNHVIDAAAVVIRVERDPSKPQAALSVTGNQKKWREAAMSAAQEWVTRDIRVNYEGDDWLN